MCICEQYSLTKIVPDFDIVLFSQLYAVSCSQITNYYINPYPEKINNAFIVV